MHPSLLFCQNPYPSIRSELGLLRVRGCVSIPNTWPQTLYLKMLVSQPCLTVCNTMDCSLPGSSVYGVLEWQEYWRGLPFPSPGDLPDSGIRPRFPTLQVDALPSEPPGKPKIYRVMSKSLPDKQEAEPSRESE